jgi:hypothetical protein
MAQQSHLWGAGASWATQARANQTPARWCNTGQVDSFHGAVPLMQYPYRAWPASATRCRNGYRAGGLSMRAGTRTGMALLLKTASALQRWGRFFAQSPRAAN